MNCKIKILMAICVCFLVIICICNLLDKNYILVKKTVEKFCDLEFQYKFSRNKRNEIVKKTQLYLDKLEKLEGTVDDFYIPNVYEIFAVRSYKILSIKIKGNKAVATVVYYVLANMTGWKKCVTKEWLEYWESIFVCYHRPSYIEKLNLIFENNNWFVIDPPFPKISVNKIIEFIEGDIKSSVEVYPNILFVNAPEAAQFGYNESVKNLNLLKKLQLYK